MVGLALLLAIMGQTGLLNPFQGLFLTVTSPVESVLTGIFRPVASVLSDAGRLNDLQNENDRLRLENEDLKNQNAELQQDAETVKELRDALGITQGGGSDKKLAASIVHRDSSVFTDVVSIDKGTNSGVQTGMVVLSSRGTLIGTVTKSLADISFVRLITDSKSKVQAQVQGGSADGIVQGSPGRGLSFNLAQGDIKVGDTLITGGLGGNYPPGLPIGTVRDVSGNSQDLFKKVTVEPLVRISTARTVLVLTSFLPQRLGLQSP
jgi:rod shape-determining protein MreC